MAPGARPVAAATDPAVFLAFDPGVRRVGVASGNSLTRSATPLATLPATDEMQLLASIGRLVAEWRPAALVVGVPRHPDGAAHAGTKRAERFVARLADRFDVPVRAVDERYSTVEAASRGDAGGRGIDAAAAAVLLEQFFSERGDAPSASSTTPAAAGAASLADEAHA